MSLVITPLPCDSQAFLSLSQSLPHIDLDNYSVSPVDEGDEDCQAGIDNGDDDDDDGSDLDLGDQPEDTGQIFLVFINARLDLIEDLMQTIIL